MSNYFAQAMDKRRKVPADDLITYLLRVKIDGQPLSDEHIVGTLRLLLIAGIDTTWSAIGSCIWHLATHAEDRYRLVSAPGLIPTAVEEFLRAYASVTMAREVIKETTVGGCPLRAGQMVMLPFPAANRDPNMFEQADRIAIDRENNRHVAFGLGIHRCIGSNLARHGNRGGAPGMACGVPRIQARARCDCDVVTRDGARPAATAAAARLI